MGDQDHDQEPDDPRAAERLRAEQAPLVESDARARGSLERAIARARQAWPSGPSPELREWAQLGGLCVGGADYMALARTRALAAGACLTMDELTLAAAGLGFASPGLVAAHLEQARRAGRVA